ncbi:MAG TPA: hypothetical protein VFE47_20900 [Tepidisphaeraceae bacterium]|jgi:hypothetical protein|nr:hypothetical protein [Tepidisphaeraceae bacterium]
MSQQLNYGLGGGRSYSQYYRHSNRAGAMGIILGIVGGLAIAVVAAFAYAYLISYVRFIYLCAIGTVAYGAILGHFPAKIMRWGKVRSLPVVLTLISMIAAASYVLHWFIWIYVLVNRSASVSLLDMLTNPKGVLRVIGAVYVEGTWGMTTGESTTGVMLGAVWVAEAGIIFGMALYLATKSQNAVPFCEKCNRWCPAGTRLRSLKMAVPHALKHRMENGEWSYFDEIGVADENADMFISIIHHACPLCGTLHTLSANAIERSVDSRGRKKTKVTCIVNKLLVSPADVEASRLSGYKRFETTKPEVGEADW